MSPMVFDLSNYKDRFGTRVAPGDYVVVVEDVEEDKSNAGNAMVNLWFRIVGGEYDGATITDRLVNTERALFRVVGFMQAIGMPTPRKRLQIDPRQFIGKRLMITVADGEPYNDTIRSEVRSYMRLAPGQTGAAESNATDLEDIEESAPSDEVSAESVDLDEVEL